jgi:hypothetical protein
MTRVGERIHVGRVRPCTAHSTRTLSNYVSQPDGSALAVNGVLGLASTIPVHVAGDVLFAGAPLGTGAAILARSIHGADATSLREVAGGDIVLFVSDGTTLAWIEGLGFDASANSWASMSLWQGTYDGSLHTLDAARVRDMSARARSDYVAAGAGYYVQAESGTLPGQEVYAVYRLSDGLRAVFDPLAAGGLWPADRALLVTADEMVLDTQGMLWRIDPRSLTFI